MSSVIPNLELPILQVDRAHWQKPVPGGVEPLEYSINNHEGFILSTQGFQFELPDQLGFKMPNIIQLIMGKEQLYAMAYEKDATHYTITAANLVAMYGSPVFKGFESGQKVIIAIGHLSPPVEDDIQPKFVVLWVGVVNIN